MTIKLISAAVAASIIAGCSPAARDEYKDASSEAAQAIKTDANTTAHAMKAMGGSAKQSIAKDSQEAKQKVDSGGKETSSGGSDQASQVKTALNNASGVDSSKITVTQAGSTVVLAGSVPSAHQKNQADDLAKSMCGGSYTVVDKLQVAKG